jgi:GNAT superfamily N-acetyltransferase
LPPFSSDIDFARHRLIPVCDVFREGRMDYIIRKARLEDRAAIEQLIAESARGLSRDDYSEQQIKAAIETIFGVDTDLILDGTYFVAESSGTLIGCGGWSKRKTLFGGDRFSKRDSSELDPKTEPAKIRAFFIHPDHARKGIGRAILAACESEARAYGFRSLELMSTLPGLKLYKACGYEGDERVEYEARDGLNIEFVPMRKELQ